ncbi:MAG: hypothetical protein GY940_08340 [bacterium]|nr:hypothetical protein [bacterium]
MKNYLLILVLVSFVLVSLIGFPLPAQEQHQEIVEEVGVNWWQIPVLAVDKDGNPVTDLQKGDIEVWMNQQRITNFTLVKRSVDVTETLEGTPGEPKTTAAEGTPEGPEPGQQVVFLLFDLNLSDSIAIGKGKIIARDIVSTSPPDTRFVLMTIETFAGLKFIGERTLEDENDRRELMDLIETKVKRKQNKRYVSAYDIAVNVRRRLSRTDRLMYEQQAAVYYRRKNDSFFKAFKTLYLYLNSIEDNKFVYFFSEGLSTSMRETLTGGASIYDKLVREMGDYLGRCGAVLFLINARGVDREFNSVLSGEPFLHSLTKESGGKYVEGTNSSIVTRVVNMRRAYYEVAFPDIPGIDEDNTTRDITVKSKRKGVNITSIRSIERKKNYHKMNKLEKEMLVVNLISRDPFLQKRITVYKAVVDKVQEEKRKKIYHLLLPPGSTDRPLDVYKIRVKEDGDDVQVKSVKKEPALPAEDRLQVEFKTRKGKKKNKNISTYFVLVDSTANQALVHGMGEYNDAPQDPRTAEKK